MHIRKQSRLNVIREELLELFERIRMANMSKHVFKPREGFDFILLTGFDEGKEDATSLSSKLIAMKEPVFSSNNEGFDDAFTEIVI